MNRTHVLFALVCLTYCFSPLLAEWSEPILLSELNDESDNYPTTCYVSHDGLEIYFSRYLNKYDKSLLFSASRDTVEDPFGSVQFLADLGTEFTKSHPWLSDDGLRLYYAEKNSVDWVIKCAQRANYESPWTTLRTFIEIHVTGYPDVSPALTSDERTMYWYSHRPCAPTTNAIWTASRASIFDAFGPAQLVAELTTVPPGGTGFPFVLPDNLAIYFSSTRDGYTTPDIYRASRPYDFLPWENILRLDSLSDTNFIEYPLCISPDENTIYFYSERSVYEEDEEDDFYDDQGHYVIKKGIWVSHYIPNRADFNSDGIVDLLDFAYFSQNWLKQRWQ